MDAAEHLRAIIHAHQHGDSVDVTNAIQRANQSLTEADLRAKLEDAETQIASWREMSSKWSAVFDHLIPDYDAKSCGYGLLPADVIACNAIDKIRKQRDEAWEKLKAAEDAVADEVKRTAKLRHAVLLTVGRLSNLPLPSHAHEERFSELERWINLELLPMLRKALGRPEDEGAPR